MKIYSTSETISDWVQKLSIYEYVVRIYNSSPVLTFLQAETFSSSLDLLRSLTPNLHVLHAALQVLCLQIPYPPLP